MFASRKSLPLSNQRAAESHDLSSAAISTSFPVRPSVTTSALLAIAACNCLPPSSPSLCFIMASSASVSRLIAYRRATPASLLSSSLRPLGSVASFSSSASRAATPAGPPQPGFRIPPPKRWDTTPESSVDNASKYFLLAEMFRGMYVVLEQFFRPPYVASRVCFMEGHHNTNMNILFFINRALDKRFISMRQS